jgi:hypothetical protein
VSAFKVCSLLLLVPLLACNTDRIDEAPAAPQPEATHFELGWLAEREVYEPQLVVDESGTLLLIWREKGEEGSDLFAARRAADGSFGPSTRVNDEASTVESFPHDEIRAAIAVGSGGRLAVAWADRRGQVRAALSKDGGASFTPSVRLDQSGRAAYRGFPALTFGASGALHAIWIDSRHAEGFAEEPADLFHATVLNGVVTEANLTAEQEPTVCGCCRTYLEAADDGEVRGLFRNADADGYRDIFSTSGSEAEGLGPPARIGEPLWKLEGCPMSGPVSVAGRVLWPDGSSGKKVLMEAAWRQEAAQPLFSGSERGDWSARLSPRPVATAGESGLALLPGRPTSRLIARDSGSWSLLQDDLPAWATTAAALGDALIVVGAVDGEVQSELRALGASGT